MEIPIGARSDRRDGLAEPRAEPAAHEPCPSSCLYAPVSDAAVRVRVYHGESSRPASDLMVRSISSPFFGIPSAETECVETPAFNMVDLTPHLDPAGGAVRVRIDSLTPQLRYWPMISVTSNRTQFVSLVTPQ